MLILLDYKSGIQSYSILSLLVVVFLCILSYMIFLIGKLNSLELIACITWFYRHMVKLSARLALYMCRRLLTLT